MTRAECEKKLAEHLEAMVAILHQYSPGSTYLSAAWYGNAGGAYFCINNAFCVEAPDRKTPINCHKIGGSDWVSMNV